MSESQVQQLMLQLPYQEITTVANRSYLRENFKQSARTSYYIYFNLIKERDGFNSRIIYEDIPELADEIFAEGLREPFVLDILPDGTAYIEEGYRRWRAISLLVEQGRWKENTLVEFYPNKAEMTELKRMANQFISNNKRNKKKLKPVEQAKVAWNVKNLYTAEPMSHEKVAEVMLCSRQTIDNLIRIAEADDRLRQEMITADLNITECLSLLKSKKTGDAITDKAEEQSHVTGTAIPPPPKDELAGDLAELKELQQETPEEAEKRIAAELEELLKISDEIKVSKLKLHKDRKLAADAFKITSTPFVDEDSGETVDVEHKEVIAEQGTVLDETIIEDIQNAGVKTVFVYKPGCEPVAKSVITVEPEKKAKDKYDEKRPEIKNCNKAIQLIDKIEAIVTKLDVPEDVKKDLAYNVHWAVVNMQEAREWIHKNEPR